MGRSVVSMETSGLLALSVIVLLIFHHGQLLLVGRTSGGWWNGRDAGAFYCFLHAHPSWEASHRGASILKWYK